LFCNILVKETATYMYIGDFFLKTVCLIVRIILTIVYFINLSIEYIIARHT